MRPCRHEFGHAVVCKRYGGEVHTMGVMLLVFTPLPYMDATSSWSFRSRWQRGLVGAAGMMSEIFIAALATFLWAYSGPGVWQRTPDRVDSQCAEEQNI